MRLIKISKNHQITIPKIFQYLCRSGWFAMNVSDNEITLKPIEPITTQSQKEILKELLEKSSRPSGSRSNQRPIRRVL